MTTPYLRAVAYMAAHVPPETMTRLTSLFVYLHHRGGGFLGQQTWANEPTEFQTTLYDLPWALNHSAAREEAERLVRFYIGRSLAKARTARQHRWRAQQCADAMTALEYRTAARRAIAEGHGERGRARFIQREIIARPMPQWRFLKAAR